MLDLNAVNDTPCALVPLAVAGGRVEVGPRAFSQAERDQWALDQIKWLRRVAAWQEGLKGEEGDSEPEKSPPHPLRKTISGLIVRVDGLQVSGEAVAWADLSDEHRSKFIELLNNKQLESIGNAASIGGALEGEEKKP
jgi:hypothetical protein